MTAIFEPGRTSYERSLPIATEQYAKVVKYEVNERMRKYTYAVTFELMLQEARISKIAEKKFKHCPATTAKGRKYFLVVSQRY